MSTADNTATTRYTTTAQLLHWLIAGLIVLQFVLAEWAEDVSSSVTQLALLAQHKSFGMTVLLLALIRLGWRLRHAPPPSLPGPAWQRSAASAVHLALYVLLFALPITGWLMSSASAYSVSWFNLFTFPDLVAADEHLKSVLQDIHHTLAEALFVIALLHLLAALKHALWDKDGVLQRMTTWPMVAVAVLVAAIGITFAGPTQPPEAQPASTQSDAGPTAERTVSSLPPWVVDYSASSLTFTAEQAGASFDGSWLSFEATIQLDPANLDASAVSVVINTSNVETNDADRDTTLGEADWFDIANYPTATFVTKAMRRDGDGFAADGELTIKGQTTPVTVTFTLEPENGQTRISGETRLDRLQLGVGTGDWVDTTWVGQYVDVRFIVIAQAP